MLLTSAVLVLAQVTAGGPVRDGSNRLLGRSCLVEVTSPEEGRRRPDGLPPSFSVTRTRDLHFRTQVGRRDVRETLYLKVYTPRGHLYQTLTVPFAAREPGADGVMRHQVSARMPVTGTAIMTEGLYGEWKVEPWLGGTTAACGPPTAFVIRDGSDQAPGRSRRVVQAR